MKQREHDRPNSLATSALAWCGYGFLIIPTLVVVPISFGDKNEMLFPPRSLTLFQYRKFFFEDGWFSASVFSFKIAIVTVALALLIGAPAAYALERYEFTGKRIVMALVLGPVLIPAIVVALGLYLYFSAIGLGTGYGALVLGHTLIAIPLVIVSAMAGVRQIDRNLEAAGTVMGAGRLTVFRRITLPLLIPALLAGGLFAFLISFDEVVISYFLSKAGAPTLPVKMYGSIQWEISPVIAAVSTVLTVLSLFVALAVSSLQRKRT